MNRRIVLLIVISGLFFTNRVVAHETWKRVDAGQVANRTPTISATPCLVYAADEQALRSQLVQLTTDPAKAAILALPMPDGTMRNFRVWQTPMMPEVLADKYPAIKTFTGELA